MSAQNGGSPAFPCGEKFLSTDLAGNTTTHSKGPLHAGVSLRQYYAAKAPPEVPTWFKVKPHRPQPELPSDAHLSSSEREEVKIMRNDLSKETAASLQAICYLREYNQAVEARQKWQDRQDEIEFFAWRWYYADQMLAGPGVQ